MMGTGRGRSQIAQNVADFRRSFRAFCGICEHLRHLRSLLFAFALATLALPAAAQWRRFVAEPNVAYDGRFTFARIRYQVHGRSGWEFDYPEMERNLMTAMRELTTLRPHERGSNIHTLDDPELLRYPVAYLSEPGYWIPDSAEVAGLRDYLAKGGFLIVDDFMRGEWINFEHQMLRVLPGARFVRLQPGDQVLDTFFHVDSLKMPYPHNPYLQAEFFGIHEENDPDRRLMVVINYNNDIGDYMEWSRTSWLPVNPRWPVTSSQLPVISSREPRAESTFQGTSLTRQ